LAWSRGELHLGSNTTGGRLFPQSLEPPLHLIVDILSSHECQFAALSTDTEILVEVHLIV